MPALDFKRLPADQTRKISDTLMTQWQIEADALGKTFFKDKRQGEAKLAQLNAKYNMKAYEAFSQLQQQIEEQQRVQTLIKQPRERTRAQEVQLRMELRPEAERLVFPTERVGRAPFTPAGLRGYRQFMEPFAAAAKEQPGLEWGTPVRLQGDLVKQYLAARSQAGYDDPAWTPKQRQQFDTEWDDLMTGERNYKWDPKAPEIRSLRAVGKLQKAVAKNITPLGVSVAKKKRRFTMPTEPMTFGMEIAQKIVSPTKARYAQNPDTGERIMSKDGGRTWQKAQ